jgi:hypothetical protein
MARPGLSRRALGGPAGGCAGWHPGDGESRGRPVESFRVGSRPAAKRPARREGLLPFPSRRGRAARRKRVGPCPLNPFKSFWASSKPGIMPGPIFGS